jgi:purine-binding chemotaxis protein CheW
VTKQRSALPSSANESVAKESVPKENFVSGVLRNYLDQLLVTATQPPQKVEKLITISEEPEPVSASNIDQEHTIVVERVIPSEVEPIAPIEIERVAPVKVEEVTTSEIELITPPEIKLIMPVEVDARSQVYQSLTDQESWSSQGVECLVFSVCGLKLAVPLLFLGGVHEIVVSDVKPLIGQPSWYLGMVHTHEHNLQAIDTAKFIMPERDQNLSEQGFKYLIQLEKTPWAIACQSIDDTVRLEASEIKWRGERGKRTWLAGTVIEKMCALIDVAGLLQSVELDCKTV